MHHGIRHAAEHGLYLEGAGSLPRFPEDRGRYPQPAGEKWPAKSTPGKQVNTPALDH